MAKPIKMFIFPLLSHFITKDAKYVWSIAATSRWYSQHLQTVPWFPVHMDWCGVQKSSFILSKICGKLNPRLHQNNYMEAYQDKAIKIVHP